MMTPFPLFRCALGCVVVVLAASVAHAANARGQVVHRNGAPAVGCVVTLLNSHKVRSASVHVDTTGMYYFESITAGQYNLEIWVNPQTPTACRVTVTEPSTDLPKVTIP